MKTQSHIVLSGYLKTFLGILAILLGTGAAFAQTDLSLNSQNTSGNYSATGSINLTNGFSTVQGGTFVATIASHIPLGSSPSTGQNYIVTSVPRIAMTDASQLASKDINQVSQQVQYLDGLGRLLQSVQVKGSPSLSDIVQPVVYDAMGRQAQTFQPYTTGAGAPGSYRPDALTGTSGYANSGQYLFYQNNAQTIETVPNPYSQSLYELSPLGRVTEQGMSGATWQVGGSHSIKSAFGTNTNNEIPIWTVNSSGASYSTYYPVGTLYTQTTTDENGRTSTVYSDYSGRVVCRKTQYVTGYIYAYYIYDDLGSLRYVIPPLPTVPALVSLPSSFTENDDIFKNFFYGYHYDGRNRPTEKKIPGKGWEYMVYNKLDKVVLSQNPAQLALGLWTFSKYDANGRVVMTGNYSSNLLRSDLQSQADGFGNVFWESFSNSSTNFGYTNVSFPDISNNAANKTLAVSYYDTYAFLGNTSINPNSSVFTAPSASVDTLCQIPTGLPTGSLSNVIGASSLTYLLGINHYDTYGRTVETAAQTFLGGTANASQYDFVVNQYSFNDLPTQIVKRHYLPSGIKLTLLTKTSYDYGGRKTLLQQQYTTPGNTGPLITLAKYGYNETGQLITKHLHNATANLASSGFLQHMDYRYNSRGWMIRTNTPASLADETFPNQNDVFAEQLDYDKPNSSFTGTAAQFNGNISSTTTQTLFKPGSGMAQEVKGYVFQYDALSRLTSSSYKAASGNDQYNEALTYDELGNVLTLNRNVTATTFLNKLTYNYGSGTQRGNILLGVQDNGGSEGYTGTYTYWPSGSQKTDTKTNVTNISYNELNLPSTVTIAGGKSLSFIYSAAGEKLERVIKQGSMVSEDRSYVNGIEYVSGAIEYIHSPEGRAVPVSNGNGFTLQYQITDHLGNTRAVISDADGNGVLSANGISQLTDYYAFGRQANTYDSYPSMQYKFNGKEYSADLTAYDYGARYYNPIIARWNSVDAMAEKSRKWNPYNYAYNNPIRNIDPDGNFSYDLATEYSNAVSMNLSQIQYNGYNNAMQDQMDDFALSEYNAGHSDYLPMKYDPFWQAYTAELSKQVTEQYSAYTKGHGSDAEDGGGGLYYALNSGPGSDGPTGGLGRFLIGLTPFGGVVDFTNSAKEGNVGGAILGLASTAAFFTGGGELSSMTTSSGMANNVAELVTPVRSNIALGLGSDLDRFSSTMGFPNYRQFTTGGGIQFEQIGAAISNPSVDIHFNMTDFSRYRYLRYDPSQPVSYNNITNWELNTILTDPGALNRTTFYRYENDQYVVKPPPSF